MCIPVNILRATNMATLFTQVKLDHMAFVVDVDVEPVFIYFSNNVLNIYYSDVLGHVETV